MKNSYAIPISTTLVKKDMLDQSLLGRFAMNSSNGVIAICDNRTFSIMYHQYMQKVGKLIPPTERVVVLVPSVVTYAENEASFRPIHAGIAGGGLKMIIDMVLRKMYGEAGVYFDDDDTISEKCMLEVGQKLFRIERRLYVPFATDNYQLLWQMFSAYTQEEAREHLLAGISAVSR